MSPPVSYSALGLTVWVASAKEETESSRMSSRTTSSEYQPCLDQIGIEQINFAQILGAASCPDHIDSTVDEDVIIDTC